MAIPEQLNEPQFSFYLIGTNSKLPLEKEWNTKNNYSVYDKRLHQHIKAGGNYGVVTGYGNLIVLDFDNQEYYDSIKDKLPETFTVLSAGRRLPHLYYTLDGELFKKTSVRDKEDKTLCDIQAARSGIVAPGSCINRRFYEVIKDKPIAEIKVKQLQDIFNLSTETTSRKPRDQNQKVIPRPEKEEIAHKILKLLGIRTTKTRNYQCPFHAMSGNGNLSVLPSGKIYCFHEQRTWSDIFDFAEAYCYFKGDDKMKLVMKYIKKEDTNKNEK